MIPILLLRILYSVSLQLNVLQFDVTPLMVRSQLEDDIAPLVTLHQVSATGRRPEDSSQTEKLT